MVTTTLELAAGARARCLGQARGAPCCGTQSTDRTKRRRCSERLPGERYETITHQLTDTRVEEIENAGLSVAVVATYCDEFGGDIETVSVVEVGDAFMGSFESPEEFVRAFAQGYERGAEISTSWPPTCIDWERAGAELMENFSEVDGYYFALG